MSTYRGLDQKASGLLHSWGLHSLYFLHCFLSEEQKQRKGKRQTNRECRDNIDPRVLDMTFFRLLKKETEKDDAADEKISGKKRGNIVHEQLGHKQPEI